MIEEQKDIEGFEGLYQVSNLGRVKCLEHTCPGRYKGRLRTVKEHIMTNAENKTNGYVYVSLSNLNRGRTFLVHRLVAKAFLPNPDNKNIINHKNENKHDNRVTNLEWCTSYYNNTYNNVHLKRKHYVHKYEYDLNKIKNLEEKLSQLKSEFVKKYPSIESNDFKQ